LNAKSSVGELQRTFIEQPFINNLDQRIIVGENNDNGLRNSNKTTIRVGARISAVGGKLQKDTHRASDFAILQRED